MYFNQLLDIHQHPVLSVKDKFRKLRQLLQRLFVELTQHETLQFSSLFVRIVFLANKHGYDKKKQWALQHFRKQAQAVAADRYTPTEGDYWTSLRIMAETISFFTKTEIPPEIEKLLPHSNKYLSQPHTNLGFIGEMIEKIKIEVVENQKDNKVIIGRMEGNEVIDNVQIKYGIANYNDNFNDSLQGIWVGSQLNLLEVRQDKEGFLIPRFFVLEPDFLVDVTAIAECNQKTSYYPELYLLKKFAPNPKNPAILLGNLANFFLDELLNEDIETPLKFEEVFQKTFKLYPIDYTLQKELQDNESFKKFMTEAKKHFNNIRQVLQSPALFETDKINVAHCYLEPAFYAEKYGIQGRLDFLHDSQDEDTTENTGENSQKKQIDIVELKSSKSVPANNQLWENHVSQTTLYQLLLQSVFGLEETEIRPAILYSAAETNHLRFAPAIRSKEQSLLNLRNRIIAAEYKLAMAQTDTEVERIMMSVSRLLLKSDLPPFTRTEIENFIQKLTNITDLERSYFYSFVNFTAREQLLAKIGDIDYETAQGHAALWTAEFGDKQEGFSILYDLEIIDNQIDMQKPLIIFKRTNPENDFVNFREGDIAVLYPFVNADSNVLRNQIFKGSIVQISKEQITMRLRFRQKNKAFFEQFPKWAIEHDLLDTSFNAQFKGLFAFVTSEKQAKKDLLLGLVAPKMKRETRSED
jgi:DNA replication ATP-dependent helicase Dna2